MTKLLRQFGDQVWSNGLTSSINRERLFRCLGSSSPFLQSRRRSVEDLVPSRRRMNTATHPRSEEASAAPPAPAPAVNPRWVLLSRDINGSPRDSSDVADGKTAVPSRCSTGRPFRVSLDLVAPPSISFLHHDLAGVSDEENAAAMRQSSPRGRVIAAHGDSVLCTIYRESRSTFDFDHFIYTAAGAAAGRPPSLSFLPACYIPTMSDKFWRDQYLSGNNDYGWRGCNKTSPSARAFSPEDTGILRCGDGGDGEVLVAQLEVTHHGPSRDTTAELCVLRPGRGWELKRAVAIVDAPAAVVHKELLGWNFCAGRTVVAVGSRFLCWANYSRSTVLVWDMAEDEDSPMLRYLKLPVEPCEDDEPKPFSDDEVEDPELRRNMCGEGATDTVRLVSIDPRCCCGGHGTSTCARSRFAFKVTAWTMNLGKLTAGKTPPAWAKAGELDSDEIWALPGYEGLPRTPLERPVVSSDNPDVVCFQVRDELRPGVLGWKASKVEVDMRKKVLLSAVPCDADTYPYYDRVVAVNLHG